ncbi:MAG: D-alanine--D-alanine ligase [Candidatus Desulfacyla sp.]
MRVAVVHHAVGPDAPADEQDVLDQAEAVSSALRTLGHDLVVLPCTLNLEHIRGNLTSRRVEAVFNLVESLHGTGRLIHLFPALLDAMGLPYTGSSALSILTTSHKILAKRRLQAAGIATPSWVGPFPPDGSGSDVSGAVKDAGDVWIIKSLWEHASIGLDERSIVEGRREDVAAMLPQRASLLGGACFAEGFVEGREFNLSVLTGPEGPQVLPPAEILFEDVAPGAPRMVGYQAKWDPGSHAYQNTPRRFSEGGEDGPLLHELTEVALRCWDLFSLRGYARVDFRVDDHGRPWVLEVNANPCLSPDAGFAAALQQAGIPFEEAIRRILAETVGIDD